MQSPCLSPFRLYALAEHTTKASNGRVMRSEAPCGRCDVCVAMRKQEWTGRLVAEGLTSASVAFVTLTYKDKPDGFPYKHVQDMLKRLRIALWRKHRCGVRFIATGERGDLFGRQHWHLLLFLDRPVNLGPWGKETHKNQLWPFWPHGWTTISNVESGLLAVKARYLIKYAIKGHGRHDLPRARMSLKPGLGVPYLKARAREWARDGLVPIGTYTLPGLRWERGKQKGRPQRFRLSGCTREAVIDAWRSEWMLTGRPEPTATPWLAKYDDEAVEAKSGLPPFNYRLTSLGRIRVDTPAENDRAAVSEGRYLIAPDGRYAWCTIYSDGRAYVGAHADAPVFGMIPVEESWTEVLDLTGRDAVRLDAWLRKVRGPQWKTPYGQEPEESPEQKRTRWRAAAHEWAKQTIEDLRRKHGVSPVAHSIYNSSYDFDAAQVKVFYINSGSEFWEYDHTTGEVWTDRTPDEPLTAYGCYGDY